MRVNQFLASLGAVATVAALCAATPMQAAAASVEVFALQNSSSGGTALNTGVDLLAGDRLVVSVDPADCWSAGADNQLSVPCTGVDNL